MDLRRLVIASLTAFVCWSVCVHGNNSLSSFDKAEWPNHGGGIANRREAAHEHKISPRTVSTFKTKWRVETGGDVSVTPSIADGVVYFTTWGGEVYAVSEDLGHIRWRTNLTVELNSTTFLLSRHTPVLHEKYLLIGVYGPSLQIALNRHTGKVLWFTLLDPHPYAVMVVSGTVFESSYYVGISSQEEVNLNEPCCSFQGSLVKMDIRTGRVIWQTKMLPDNGGMFGSYAGAAIWGSSPPIDEKRRHVYIATGNLYQVPPDVQACREEQDNKTTPDVPNPCIRPEDHSESILALDLDSGEIVWSKNLGGVDVWTAACIPLLNPPGPDNCPASPGEDYDFGEAPMLLRVRNGPSDGMSTNLDDNQDDNQTGWRDIVVAGQKSGFVWALDRDNGTLVWDAVAGPGGTLGGASWGSATDGERVYTSIINNLNRNFTLDPSSTVITAGGGWVAMDAATGEILWSVATPNSSYPIGPVTITNGVLMATSLGSPNGMVHALDARDGTILWNQGISANASISGGVSVHKGCIFVGEGTSPATYAVFPPGIAKHGHAVDAMCVD